MKAPKQPSSQSKPPRPKIPANLDAAPPDELWHAFFRKNRLQPDVVGDIILQLHKDGKHQHVIAAIQAALVTGHSQPWMYDVLALSMQIADRPKAEIERVLLSRIDFTATDVPNMLFSAAQIRRFGGDRQALRLYRQASRLAPTRPEPYILGLKLARQLKDAAAIQWAATGVLQYAWPDDYAKLHRQAENAALEAQAMLRKQAAPERASALRAAIAEARKRDLVVRLTWSGEGDLDLSVEEPLGTECNLDTRRSRGGGILVHDGYGPRQENCYEEYVCPFAMPGDYRIRIEHVSGNIVGKRARLTIVRNQGTRNEQTRKVSITLDKRGVVVPVTLKTGRRKELSRLAPGIDAPVARGPVRPRRPRLQLRNARNPQARKSAREFAASRRRVRTPRAGALSAVGFQPVIAVIPEGISLTGRAVVSPDRRYVRMSLSPTFSTVTDVLTFSFQNFGGAAPAGGTGGQP